MDMFENETKMNAETNMKVMKRILQKSRILVGVMGALLLAMGIALLMTEIFVWKEGDYLFNIFMIVFGTILIVFCFALSPILSRASKKTMRDQETVLRYTFHENEYQLVTALSDGTTSQTQGNYLSFTKVCEFKDMWILYLNKSSVFAVSKEGMITGTEEEFTQFLRQKFGAKYKVCFNRK
jgi:uncharacterized membrane protein